MNVPTNNTKRACLRADTHRQATRNPQQYRMKQKEAAAK